MSSKKWLIMLPLCALAALLLVGAFNVAVDPFGVFGDRIFNWYGYNETNNPRVAKLEWLEKNGDNYDSYVIGSSSAASYNTEELNEYFDASFYNLFVYGCDTGDYRDFAKYLIENHTVKNLVLNLGVNETNTYDAEDDPLKGSMHAKADGKSLPLFYLKYAFLSTRQSLDKLSSKMKDTDLPQRFDVFEPLSGCYDKRVRDVEKIGDAEAYQSEHESDFNYAAPAEQMPYIDKCVSVVSDIKKMCEQNGINLTVICSPVYIGQWRTCDESKMREYKTKLAGVCDYWDFSLTPISYDSRYFYDSTHFRNDVGSMVLARIFENENISCPDRFGRLVTEKDCKSYLDSLYRDPPQPELSDYTTDLPVLLYHHISDETGNDAVISAASFERQMRCLFENGYTAVTISDIEGFVLHGGALPEKPVLITFDDGYLSNYESAFPILQKYGLSGTIFAIGSSVGHTEYKDTDIGIIPHFDYEQAREMEKSGVIEIQSHTYDMHQNADYEKGDTVRINAAPLLDESEKDYAKAFRADAEKYNAEAQRELGHSFSALSFPGGSYTEQTQVEAKKAGFTVTFSIETDRRNTLVRGLKQSLYALCRYNMTNDVSNDRLLEILQNQPT